MKIDSTVTISEYGSDKPFKVIKQLESYNVPVFLVKPIDHTVPEKFNGVMVGKVLIKKENRRIS